MTTLSETSVYLTNWRLSFFHGFEPSIITDKVTGKVTKRWSFTLLAPPDHPDIKKVLAAINAAGQSFFRDKWTALAPAIQANGKLPFKKGEIARPLDEVYKGMVCLAAGKDVAKGRFSILETRGGVNVPLTQEDGRPYPGCYVNAKVNFFGYNKGSNGIGCGPEGIQFIKHGEAFGGGRVAQLNEFGLHEVAESADAPPPSGAPADDMANLLGM